ncbi:FAD-dependent oxidoreductase [Brevundimonas diminuta]|uniref:FAD-dependent oxidoreductase n=1 Tax=Brevundimonas diminuta TaxID=293 RepID=UPI0035E2F1E0
MPHDAVVIGGSYAGLSAALQLVRARRRVLVIDDGRPRNRFAARAHGVLSNDGRPGSEIAATARAQVATYPTAAFRMAEAVDAARRRRLLCRLRRRQPHHGPSSNPGPRGRGRPARSARRKRALGPHCPALPVVSRL